MKRIISVFLVLSMFMVPLAACSGDTDPDAPSKSTIAASTTADPNAITTYLESLNEAITELDYGGEQVVMLGRSGTSTEWMNDDFVVEELMNEPINDTIYNRNITISEMLGVEIIQVPDMDDGAIGNAVAKMVNSGEDTYDIVAGSVNLSTPMMQSGYLYNLYDNGIEKYLSPDSQWWPQYWIEEAEIENKLYILAGPASLSFTVPCSLLIITRIWE